jgi:hypothetical protein
MIRMVDSISVSGLPKSLHGIGAVGGYMNGKWPTYAEFKKLFGKTKEVLGFSVFLANTGDCLDIETGDATPNEAPSYVKVRKAAGLKKPAVYTFAGQGRAVINALLGAGYKREEFLYISAHWGRGPHICSPKACGYPQADGTQWTDGGKPNYDESILKDTFFEELRKGGHTPAPDRRKIHWQLVWRKHLVWHAAAYHIPKWAKALKKLLKGARFRKT